MATTIGNGLLSTDAGTLRPSNRPYSLSAENLRRAMDRLQYGDFYVDGSRPRIQLPPQSVLAPAGSFYDVVYDQVPSSDLPTFKSYLMSVKR